MALLFKVKMFLPKDVFIFPSLVFLSNMGKLMVSVAQDLHGMPHRD